MIHLEFLGVSYAYLRIAETSRVILLADSMKNGGITLPCLLDQFRLTLMAHTMARPLTKCSETNYSNTTSVPPACHGYSL